MSQYFTVWGLISVCHLSSTLLEHKGTSICYGTCLFCHSPIPVTKSLDSNFVLRDFPSNVVSYD